MTDNRKGILERWFPRKVADEKQAELETAAERLDTAGVARKEAPAETKLDEVKALDLGQLADEILSLAQAEGDPAAKREQLIAVLGQLVSMDGQEQAPAPEGQQMSTGLMALSEDTQKAIKSVMTLNDDLIKTQEGITADVDEITKSQKAIAETIKTLASVPDLIKTLTERIKSVEDQLAGRPRAASKANETKLSAGEDLLKNVEKQALDVDPFYGRPMKPTVNS